MDTQFAHISEASVPIAPTTVDVVVVGSGAAALSAHDRGSEVVIVEADTRIGGTTAISGGIPWIPLNDHMIQIDKPDNREEVDFYLSHVTSGRERDPALLAAIIDNAAEAVRYLEAHTPLSLDVCTTFSDYHVDLPGEKMQ